MRLALVVANDEYDDPGLKRLVAPAQDAAALAEVLADASVGGFDVKVLRNESAQEIRFAVEDFFADRSPADLLLLHFSCHGLKNAAGELFLAVADTKPTRLASTAVAADFVNRQMADSRAQRIALFLDCCYGGAFPRGMVVRAAGEAQVRDAFAGQEEVGGGRGRVVVTASSAMEYAFEGGQLATDAPPTPSVFTSAVVDGLTTGEADRDGDGWVGLTELVGYVSDRVHRVTPNQHPQMWTFGSQGELLIARSKIRRITPAPLAPEIAQAMESPLPAARFGVVDYLRERLHDTDLAQAYAAWQALHEMTVDDSRRVSEAATEALSTAELRVQPESVDLTRSSSAELYLSGPPLALTAAASPSAPWLKLEQSGEVVRLRADQSPAGVREASVVLAGPVGEVVVPVHLTGRHTEPPPAPREPAPAKKPVTAAAVPWWLVAVLIVGSAGLIAVNWPGAYESQKLWYDEDNTGWYVYRSWSDPVFLASAGALVAAVAAVAARSGRLALGIAVGCLASIAEDGVLTLGAVLTYDQTRRWALATAVAVVLLVILVRALRPGRLPLRPVPPRATALVVAGGLLLLAGVFVKHPDGLSLFTVTKLVVLEPFVTVGLAWLALTDTKARSWLSAAATTYVVLSAITAVPALTTGDSPAAFWIAFGGNLLVATGVLTRVLRLQPRA